MGVTTRSQVSLRPLSLFTLVFTVTLHPGGRVAASDLNYGIHHQLLEDLAYGDLRFVQSLFYKLKHEPPKDVKVLSTVKRAISNYIRDVRLTVPPKQRDEGEIALKNILGANEGDESRAESWMRQKMGMIADNPVSVIRLLYRYVHFLPALLDEISPIWGNFSQHFPAVMPDMEDLGEAIGALYRIARMYDLDIDKLSRGEIREFDTGVHLDAIHCYELSVFFMEKNEYAIALQWMLEALKKVTDRKVTDKTFNKKMIIIEMRELIALHNNFFRTNGTFEVNPEKEGKKYFELYTEIFPTPIAQIQTAERTSNLIRRLTRNVDQLREKRDESWEAWKSRAPKTRKDRNATIMAKRMNFFKWLCMGGNLQTEKEKSRLFCWYEFKEDLYYTIGPMKKEFLAMDPDLVRVYGIIGPKAIERIAQQSRGHYIRGVSKHFLEDKFISVVSGDKIGMDFNGREHGIGTGSIRIHTRIVPKYRDPKNGSNSIISLYSFGGHFLPHSHDKPEKGKYVDPRGLSMGFALVYLSDVQAGGHTPFLTVGVTAQPIAGSYILWYDCFSDGEHDLHSFHGACPVLIGRKLTLAQQDLMYDQFLHHKCSLRRGQRFRVKVNGVVQEDFVE